MTSLVIVESPAKCKKIEGFLGPGWHVMASMGQIRALEEDIQAIGIDRDFEPSYHFLKEKAKAISQLKEAAKKASTIYLASDDDREGEAIAYSVAILLDLNLETTPRSVFHEITAKAVKQAIQNPRRIDMNRVNAQQARAVLDMMVGFTISPLLWNYVGPALSAGRCQTPALRLVCEKEQEIKKFASSTVWKIKGPWENGSFLFDANLKDELEDQESALNFLENIHKDQNGTVIDANTKVWTESPPKPLITSTLQQEASALFASNPKRTMQIAQKLYEGGHITYMRTDHAILSEEAVKEASEFVVKFCGDAYIPRDKTTAPKQKKKDESNQAQEAHEAIRPTHFDLQELPANEDWDSLDRRIYKLIWNRAVQSVMVPAKGDERAITFVADGDPGEFPWEAKWRRTTFMGWKKIGTAAAQLDETEAQEQADAVQAIWIQAVSLKEGSKLKWKSLETFPQISRPPPRFNEATLVRELEKKGIGRPSTYASLVSTLFEKKYAEKKDKPAQQLQFKQFKLPKVGQWPPTEETTTKSIGAEKDKMVPTPLGMSCLQFCVKEFPQLFAYDFTSHMETRLDKVAQGGEAWKQLCRDTWDSYKDHLQELKRKGGSNKNVNAKVREFGNGIKAVLGKRGPILLKEDPSGEKEKTRFFGWPEGVGFHDLKEEDALRLISNKEAPTALTPSIWGTFEAQPIVEKKGPFGIYFECGDLRVPCSPGETAETIQAKFQQKRGAVNHSIGSFEIRQGPYGLFMYKKAVGGKKPTFVGLPEGLDPKTLTVEAAERIYKNGIEQKKEGGFAARGGSSNRCRGSFRGRGRGRGRGH
jgi:DNA topoisomerase-1